jgi:copper(I)-binding protein
MKMRIMVPALLALALTAAAIYSFAQNAENGVGSIIVREVWARATPPGTNVAAVYATIDNRGRSPDRLIGIASSAASSAMIHQTIEEGGISQMREGEGGIAPRSTLKMEPGSTHIMLMGLNKPLKEGEPLDITFSFEKAGKVTIRAAVRPIGATAPMQAME